MRLASVSLLAQFTPCPAGLRSRRPLPVAACLAPRTTAGVSNGEQAQASSLLREVPVQVSAQDPWASDTFRQELRQRLVRLYDSASFRQGGKLLPPNLPTAQAFDNLQEALGYRWQEPKLLKLAVLHGSASEAANNCLAWLGDAVLYAIVTEHLTLAYPAHTQSELSPARAHLISRSVLARRALDVGVDQCAALAGHIDRASLRGSGKKSSVLAEMLEAVLGAMYVDAGFSAVRRVQHTRWPVPEEFAQLLGPATPLVL